jgi:hypothetical protein
MIHEISERFEFSWFGALAQMLALISLVLLPIGVFVSGRVFRGAQAIFWVAVSCLIPLIGPAAALVAARLHRAQSNRPAVRFAEN